MTELRGWRLRRALAATVDDATPSSDVLTGCRLDDAPAAPTAGAKSSRPRWPDVAPPLDLSIDYSRTAERARLEALYAERLERAVAAGARRPAPRQVSARGRREDADELVPFWTAPPGYCRVCGEPTPTRRHRWHDTCVASYNALASGAGFRNAVWDRDHGRCAACPADAPAQPRWNGSRCPECGHVFAGGSRSCYLCHPWRLRVPGQPDPPPPPPLEPVGWDADHIVPLVDGGPNTLTNAQTLCLPHHRAKTAIEARTRAARKRELQ